MSDRPAAAPPPGSPPPGSPPNDQRADVRLLFPTPCASFDLQGMEQTLGQLRQIILARMASHPSTQASNLGGWQSDWNMQDWAGQAFEALMGGARSLANSMTRDRQGKAVSVDWKANGWANVNGPGQGNEFHIHPGAFWSGVFFVDDGGAAEDPTLGGELELLDPRGAGPAMYAPLLAFAGPGGLSVGGSETLRPKSGRLVLFPAWLYHQVRPYRGSGQRISIAFNLSL